MNALFIVFIGIPTFIIFVCSFSVPGPARRDFIWKWVSLLYISLFGLALLYFLIRRIYYAIT